MKIFMQIVGKNSIGNFLKIFLQICFYFGIILLVILPFILRMLGFNIGVSMFIIYTNGIILLLITRNFIELFDSLKNNTPFCKENVKILRKTGVISFIESVFWLIDLGYQILFINSKDIVFNVTLGFLSILFLGVAIALYILSELFKQAYDYKKENELTI